MYVYIYHTYFIHFSIGDTLGGSVYLGQLMNAMSTGMCVQLVFLKRSITFTYILSRSQKNYLALTFYEKIITS